MTQWTTDNVYSYSILFYFGPIMKWWLWQWNCDIIHSHCFLPLAHLPLWQPHSAYLQKNEVMMVMIDQRCVVTKQYETKGDHKSIWYHQLVCWSFQKPLRKAAETSLTLTSGSLLKGTSHCAARWGRSENYNETLKERGLDDDFPVRNANVFRFCFGFQGRPLRGWFVFCGHPIHNFKIEWVKAAMIYFLNNMRTHSPTHTYTKNIPVRL